MVTTLTQAKEDEEEYSPEWIAAIEKMMQAYDKKKKIDEDFERPSFTLFEPGAFGTPLDGIPEGSRNEDAAGNNIDEGRTVGDVLEPEVTLRDADDTGMRSDATHEAPQKEQPISDAPGKDPHASTEDGTAKQKEQTMEEIEDDGATKGMDVDTAPGVTTEKVIKLNSHRVVVVCCDFP